jgi:hypothetical protein
MHMVTLQENSITITIPTHAPSQKLGELQGSLIYVINDFFGHLGNEVDVEGGAAYNDLLTLLRATMPTPAQLGLLATPSATPA